MYIREINRYDIGFIQYRKCSCRYRKINILLHKNLHSAVLSDTSKGKPGVLLLLSDTSKGKPGVLSLLSDTLKGKSGVLSLLSDTAKAKMYKEKSKFYKSSILVFVWKGKKKTAKNIIFFGIENCKPSQRRVLKHSGVLFNKSLKDKYECPFVHFSGALYVLL